MSASLAPGGSIIAMGLPGTTRITKNTITATPKSVRHVVARRRKIARKRVIKFQKKGQGRVG